MSAWKVRPLSSSPSRVAFWASIGRGYNRGSIADEHGVSRETVKTHIAGIYRKVHVHSHQELIAALEARAAQVEKDETT